jgi:hypothetical protein
MKYITCKNEKITIRNADKSDAKALIEYLEVIGGVFYDSLLMGLLID